MARVLQLHARAFRTSFRAADSLKNLRAFATGHVPPQPRDLQGTDPIAKSFTQWNLQGPLKLSLPPGYANHPYSNIVYLESMVRRPVDTLMFSGAYPHPSLDVREVPVGPKFAEPYHRETHSANAALLVWLEARIWPYGYTAWRDLLTMPHPVKVPTPTLIASDGTVLKPVEAQVLDPLNRVRMDEATTEITLSHLSPVVWRFAHEGTPSRAPSEYPLDYVLEHRENEIWVSYMPPFPTAEQINLGLFLLQPKRSHAPPKGYQPTWWTTDEALRKEILAGGDPALRQALFAELERLHPRHPMLEHYRVVKDLWTPNFTTTWLHRQNAGCDPPTWYLLPWTEVSWSELQTLPCFTAVRNRSVDFFREYVDGAVLLRFRTLDSKELRSIARDLVGHTYLAAEDRAFNYIVTDFAKLWLDARP
jgi:hypothetical protein